MVYFLVFHRLNVKAIHTWDESLFATRAFYLAYHCEYFTNWKNVDHSELNHPNTKPPLVGLIQAASFKIFGYNRMALRLPIAIMGLICALLIALWIQRANTPWYVGIIATIVLLGSRGFNSYHILRTGDHDAALALWLTASIFCFWMYHFYEKKPKWLILFFVFTAFSVLTKSIMGFMMLPPLALFALFFTPILQTLKKPSFYLGITAMVVLIVAFYGILQINHPGFLQLVWDNEVGGRYGSTIDNHQEPWFYYIRYLFYKGFTPLWVFTLLGVFFGIKTRNTLLQKLTILVVLCAAFYLVIISSAGTKLLWYAAPLYPLFAILAAIGLVESAKQIVKPIVAMIIPIKIAEWIFIVLVSVAFTAPDMVKVIYKNSTEHTSYIVERYELALDRLRKDKPELKTLKIHTKNEWYPSVVFLANKYEKVHGYNLEIITSVDSVSVGDLLFGEFHPRMKPYELEKLAEYSGDIKLYRVKALTKSK